MSHWEAASLIVALHCMAARFQLIISWVYLRGHYHMGIDLTACLRWAIVFQVIHEPADSNNTVYLRLWLHNDS